MGNPNKPPRAREPRIAAVVKQEGCTGCEACLTVCPVDSIEPVPAESGIYKLVEIDLDRCIGCGLCPKICPWDTIEMFDYKTVRPVAEANTIHSVVPGHKAGAPYPVS